MNDYMIKKVVQLNDIAMLFACLLFVFAISQSNEEECGINNNLRPQDRVLGGRDAEESEFPWMVSIQYYNGTRGWIHMCGGAIIDRKVILTAAHCDMQRKAPYGRIVAGCRVNSNVKNQIVCQIINFSINDFISHPWFSKQGPGQLYDVAVIRLQKALVYTNRYPGSVSPICIPDPIMRPDPVTGDRVRAAGWGLMEDRNNPQPYRRHLAIMSERLKTVDLEVMDHNQCSQTFLYYSAKTQLCIGSRKMHTDTCGGDSGGPVIMPMDQHPYSYYVVAVVSKGHSCGKGYHSPSVYTRVSHFKRWIATNSLPYVDDYSDGYFRDANFDPQESDNQTDSNVRKSNSAPKNIWSGVYPHMRFGSDSWW